MFVLLKKGFGGKFGYNWIPFQALDWLQQSGEHYLSTHTSPGTTVAETQELLNQHREFCVSAKVRPDRNMVIVPHLSASLS